MKSLIIFLFFLFISTLSQANHSVAANITYTHIAGNTYKLTLSFYRDCTGQLAPFNVSLTVVSASCGDSLNVILNQLPGTGQEIPPDCVTQPTTCNGGILPGLQEWVYQGNITLPSQCPDWTFGYYLCCRNGSITNITNAISSGFYVYSTLNNTIGSNNSSLFINKPIPFLCVGSYFCFNQGAIDIDGDSLTYSLIAPFENIGVPVTYQAGYSSTQPMNSIPPMTFNSQTGEICFNANLLQIGVLAVLVKEYRNGVLIGQVERDIQITVLNCPCVILPVELSDFQGETSNFGNRLFWTTLSEHNNNYFILRKSSDMISFMEVARINSKGNSNSIKEYEYIDKTAFGLEYYSLSQVDYDGQRENFKKIVALNNIITNIKNVRIYNILGQEVKFINGINFTTF